MVTINFKTLIINKNNQKENHSGWTKLRAVKRRKKKMLEKNDKN
jgi:hypothetical protein